MPAVGSRLLTLAARTGYAARGIVYLLIGGLAVLAALDLGGQTVGTRGALRALLAHPGGAVLLGALAAGIACFAVWRLIQALTDPSHYGRDLKGLSIRTALAVSALVYLGIAGFAVRLVLDWDTTVAARQGSALRDWLTSLMTAPYGPWITGALGLAVTGMGITKVVKAWRAEFGEHLECAADVRRWAIPVSRFGLTARGIVFVVIGASIILAAVHVQVERAAGLAGILQALEHTPFGWILLAITALGLVSFGIFGLIEAMYRRIEAQDIDCAGEAARVSSREHARWSREILGTNGRVERPHGT